MRMTNRNRRRSFYVVQFIEVPFEHIDNYVCVPYSWIIFQKLKIFVTYPNNEDPLETRKRVRTKERPNDSWRFYMAILKYQSDKFEDADLWIEKKFGTEEEVSKKKEPQLNRKLRSAIQSCSSECKLDKPQVKPYNNRRTPLPRISMRRPLSQYPDQNLKNNSLKLNENLSKPVVVITDHITAASSSSKQEQSVIITSNQVIQKAQTKTNYASNDEMNTQQSTQPKVIKEYQLVDLSVQFTSAKLPVEHQLSPQPPTEQQLSLQPPIDRQPSPQLIAEQHFSSKFSGKQQPSSVGQDYQQPVSMSTVDLDESKGDFNRSQNVLPEPVTDERPSTKTPPSTLTLQPNPMNKRSNLLVRHENSLPEPHSRDVTAGQSKEPNDCQKTHLHWISTAPKIVPKSSSTTNQLLQQYGCPQLPIFSVNSTLNSKFQPQVFGERNSIELADNHSFLRSQDIIDSMPSTSHHEHTSEKLTQMLKLKARQQSSVVQKPKYPVDKKTCLESMTKNIPKLQFPPNSMTQFTQSAQFRQHHLQQTQIDGSLTNDERRRMRENFISQRGPHAQGMMNTTAAQNLSRLAHQYNPFLGTSHELQYLPTQEDNLQQFTRLQDMLRRPRNTLGLDQKAYQRNAMMNGEFVIQSQPNLIKQAIQFPPEIVNQNVSINSAYSQEVKSHELRKRYIDGAHVIYKPVAPKEVNIQFPAHYLSSQSHRDAEPPQKTQDQQNYRDPRTTNTQNGLWPKWKKTMIDRATETDSKMDVSHCVEAIAGSSLPESASRAVESECQTDEWSEKEEDSFYQETSSDSENENNNEIESEKVVVPEVNQATLTAEQNVTQENEHEQSETIVDQDTLDVIGTLLTQMGTNVSFTRDMFECLRNTSLVCAETYKTLLKEVDKLNSIESLQNSASPPNNVKSQVTQGVPVGDNDNTTSVGNATTSINEQRGTFSLPKEYDPNDTKWTLKYQENKPGLVELIPQTGVYIKKKDLKRCLRKSNDCRTLARLLLTEIFSHSALSVCSWTGGKAKAFNSVNIDVRPGLDENARMVLLTFVEEHGKKRGWSMANTSAVMSTIRTKINDIRAKHEQACKA